MRYEQLKKPIFCHNKNQLIPFELWSYLNPLSGYTALAGGGIGASIAYAGGGDVAAGFQWGEIVGGLAGGGIGHYRRALKNFGGSAIKAGWHTAASMGVEGTGIGIGAGVGAYYGGSSGALMGAQLGQLAGGLAANFAVACFTAGTPLVVDWEGNSRPIDEIEVGEFVLARSEFDQDGPLELKRVEEKFVRTAVVMELIVRGQSIKTTAEHPFYVPAHGKFVAAGQLQVGEQLVGHDGKLVEIEFVGSTDEMTTVYNLRVADHHTYFVGGAIWGWDVWVHNAGKVYVSGAQDKLGTLDGNQKHHLLQQNAFPDVLNRKSGPVVRVVGKTSELGSQHNVIHRVLEGFWEPHRIAATRPFVEDYLDAINRAARTAGYSAKDAYQMTSSAKRFLKQIGLEGIDLVPQVPKPFPSQFLAGGHL